MGIIQLNIKTKTPGYCQVFFRLNVKKQVDKGRQKQHTEYDED